MLAPAPDKTLMRVDGLLEGERENSVSKASELWSRVAVSSATKELMRRLMPDDETRRTRMMNRLIRAGYYEPASLGYFMIMKVSLMIAPLLLSIVMSWAFPWPWHWTLMVGALLGFVGMFVPDIILSSITRNRQRYFRQALPDFVDLAITCVEGGMGLSEAVSQVHSEMRQTHSVLATELDFVLRDVHLGQTLGQGFGRMSVRTGVDEARALASFVEQSQKFGSEMGSALRELSDMLRFQREQRAEELAQQASVKILVPTLLFIFPTIFVVLAGPAALQIQQSFQELPQETKPAESKR
ncbi:type II secretion system F family protein [Bremerella alba]|nr:type II secretion system F family protein [Bremerella alba]